MSTVKVSTCRSHNVNLRGIQKQYVMYITGNNILIGHQSVTQTVVRQEHMVFVETGDCRGYLEIHNNIHNTVFCYVIECYINL